MTDDIGLFEIIKDRQPATLAQDSRANAMRRTRNSFRVHPVPTKPMASKKFRASIPNNTAPRAAPSDLLPTVEWFEGQNQARDRFRWTLRDSLDELLDGQRTGRWCYQHLTKTEKTYLGTAIEVNLTREFGIPDGEDLDWNINGTDVDCKFSKDLGGWEIPMEMYLCADHHTRAGKADHPALLVWMNDDASEWAAGVFRATDEQLRWKTNDGEAPLRMYNRDNKRRISDLAFGSIHWLWGGVQTDLPTNLILHQSPSDRAKVLVPDSSGQERLNLLFRHLPQRLINRQVVLAIGQQDDAPKRVRDSRIALRNDGFIILGHQGSHPQIAQALGLTPPPKGAWMSVRVTQVEPSDARLKFQLNNCWWAIARDDESGPAPLLPKDRLPAETEAI